MTTRSTSWCFTLNNWEQAEVDAIVALHANGLAQYIVIGKEVGQQGTHHLQGYIEMTNRRELSKMRKLVSGRAHFERRRGTALQASEYCKKDGDYIELGEISPGQGKRVDLDTVRTMVAAGATHRDIIDTGAGMQALKYALHIRPYKEPERKAKPRVLWFYGPSGTGKTYSAREEAKGYDLYWKRDSSKWWDGYDAHTAVIIDEYRPQPTLSFRDLLTLTDEYPTRVEVKGGSRQFVATLLIITAPTSPADTFVCETEEKEQLLRRIDEIRETTVRIRAP